MPDSTGFGVLRQLTARLRRMDTNTPNNASADIFDESQAAAYLHQKPRTLRLWRRRGLPFYKPTSKVVLYKRADLDAWLDKFRVSQIVEAA